MVLKAYMERNFPHLYAHAHTQNIDAPGLPTVIHQNPAVLIPGKPPQPVPGAVPPGVQQIADTVNNFMPVLEQITGLTRREIALQLLKTGLRGGNLSSVLDGLMGNKPVPEAKFIRYVKIFAVWVPAFVFLMGGALVGSFVLYKLAMMLVGSL